MQLNRIFNHISSLSVSILLTLSAPKLFGTEISCHDLFFDLKIPVDSQEWKRVSVRYEENEIIDPLYLVRLHQSVHDVFEPWFLKASPQSLNYKEMLRAQHIVATTDETNKAYYLGASFRNKNSKRIIEPGVFLDEKPVDPKKDRIGVLWLPYIFHLGDQVGNRLQSKLNLMSKEKFNSAKQFSYALKLPRLEFEVDVHCNVDLEKKVIQHKWPRYTELPKVRKALAEIMSDIQKISPGSNNPRLVNLLSEYTYLGANTHPFDGANFSIIMSEVNWILKYHGLKGISHGAIDFEAMFFQFDDFRPMFRKRILGQNSSPQNLVQWRANFPADSQQWMAASVRDPSQPILDENYLRRANMSVDTIFGPWFDGVPGKFEISYEQMLRAQHTLLANDVDGKGIYQGASRREENIKTGYKVRGGYFRYDSPQRDGRISFAFLKQAKISDDLTPDIKINTELYFEKNSSRPFSEPQTDTSTVFMSPHSVVQQFEMPRLKEKVKVWNAIHGDNVSVFYPKNFETRFFMETMRGIAEELRIMPRSPRNLDKVVSLLSQYSYLGAWAHLGIGANFSLAMIDIEYIFHAWGLPTISHSNLDYVAVTRSFSDFDFRFREDLIAAGAKNISAGQTPQLTKIFITLSGTAHISKTGDQNFQMGDFIGNFDEPTQLEGFSIAKDSLPPRVQIEYKASLMDKPETPWASANSFVGTRAESRAMTGFAIRVVGDETLNYEILYQARIGKDTWLPPSKNGEAVEATQPITGMKIWLSKILPKTK